MNVLLCLFLVGLLHLGHAPFSGVDILQSVSGTTRYKRSVQGMGGRLTSF